MKQYLSMMEHVRDNGARKEDRTGTGTLSVFGHQMRFDLAKGFPLVTTKKLHLRSIIHELLWFLRGDSNVRYLNDNGVSIWDEWASEDGELGPVYGVQWRSWPAPDGRRIDQISEIVETLKSNPDSRRIIVSAWNVGEIDGMALPPCHCLFQFYVADGKLSCQLYQRSADIFLGVPFNIASYALLTHMIAQQCDLSVGDFVWTGGDCHLYSNHLEQVEVQLKREPIALPRLAIKRRPATLFDYGFDDFEIYDLSDRSLTQKDAFDAIRKNGAQAVVAVGLRAATFCQAITDLPVVFSQVFNVSENDLDGENFKGVAARPPLAMQLEAWRQLSPELNSIGAIIGEGHDDLIDEAKLAADGNGLSLHHRIAKSDRETFYHFTRLAPDIDGFWLFPDNRILSASVLRTMLDYAAHHGVQVAVFNDSLLSLGAAISTTSVNADIAQTIVSVITSAVGGDMEAIPDLTPLSEIGVRTNSLASPQVAQESP